jgi:hypothetical protein
MGKNSHLGAKLREAFIEKMLKKSANWFYQKSESKHITDNQAQFCPRLK